MRNEPDNPPPPALGPVLVGPASEKDASEKTSSAKGTQADGEAKPGNAENTTTTPSNVRLLHWLDSFTPSENIANPRPFRPLQPESHENPAVLRVASAIEQS